MKCIDITLRSCYFHKIDTAEAEKFKEDIRLIIHDESVFKRSWTELFFDYITGQGNIANYSSYLIGDYPDFLKKVGLSLYKFLEGENSYYGGFMSYRYSDELLSNVHIALLALRTGVKILNLS